MNYYGGKELAESFRTVRKNTLAIAEDIPEDKYDFRPMPETRSVGELLAHIAIAQTFQQIIHGEERLGGRPAKAVCAIRPDDAFNDFGAEGKEQRPLEEAWAGRR